jgi:outer membrane protein
MPIFQGGAVHSRFTEQRHRVQESKERLRERELTTVRDTRNFFRAVMTDVARVEARVKAIKSRESALEAVRTGYEVGTRNIVELLQAQQNLFSSQYDYADSRYNYILDLLRLKQTTGVLSEDDILEISSYTDTSNPVRKLTTLSGR